MIDAGQWPSFVPDSLIEWASSNETQAIWFRSGDGRVMAKMLCDERMASVYVTLKKSQSDFEDGNLTVEFVKAVHEGISSARLVRSHEWIKNADLSLLKKTKRFLSDQRFAGSARVAIEAIEDFEADLKRSLQIFDFDHKQKSHAMGQEVIGFTEDMKLILGPLIDAPNIQQRFTTQKLNTKAGLGAYIARYLTTFFLSFGLRPHYAETGTVLEILLDERTGKYTENHVWKMAEPVVQVWRGSKKRKISIHKSS